MYIETTKTEASNDRRQVQQLALNDQAVVTRSWMPAYNQLTNNNWQSSNKADKEDTSVSIIQLPTVSVALTTDAHVGRTHASGGAPARAVYAMAAKF
ncbi:unnamed protein product [Ceratitis capitata]|uniref:(Mediterranean fruit fly) hypothetical protein n=1 Tax=Ceratitis capitata TaxID=7213 RepID=A0A811UPD5_CERCA|nr:unnamed protein product [Ceratitis capitata]